MEPLVTVLISVYNGMPYLPATIESILDQTFSEFEILIVEDCSTDNSLQYLQSLTNPRIRLLINEKNLGMAESLNKGISHAKGKYIARLDADDRAMPERLKVQYQFMESNPNLVICGSWAQIINHDDRPLSIWKQSIDPLEIRWRILFKNPYIHSSVMFKRDVVVDNQITYKDLFGTEDYQFWSDLLRYGDGANIDQVLVQYRRHERSMTEYNAKPMKAAHLEVANTNQSRLLKTQLPLSGYKKLIGERANRQYSYESAQLHFRLLKAYYHQNLDRTNIKASCVRKGQSLLYLISSKPLRMWFSFRLMLLFSKSMGRA
jgi:glycosyltransferase involved in cell wall biosynthesis